MRLDKYLVSVTDLSRSDAGRAIRAGDVTINGRVGANPAASVAPGDNVCWQGRLLRQPGYRYFMMNKPEGLVSATKDRLHDTVMQLLDVDNLEKLHIAGRLDLDTTGLLLISDDGQWTHRVTSPRRDCNKTYLLETAEPIDHALVALFAAGIKLQGELRPTKPAALDIIDSNSARLTISEGKYHQVKRMFAYAGNCVVRLHRERIGDIVLDDSLAPGNYRPLTREEVASI